MEKSGLKYLNLGCLFSFSVSKQISEQDPVETFEGLGSCIFLSDGIWLKIQKWGFSGKKQKSKQKREKGFNTLDFLPFGANPKTKWRVIFF